MTSWCTCDVAVSVHRYEVGTGSEDKEVGCLVRADSAHFQESSFTCTLLNQLDTDFEYGEHEELVGNIIRLSGQQEDQEMAVS